MISRGDDTSQQSSTTSPSALRRQIVISENQLDSREPFTGTREISSTEIRTGFA
jgi:hypothetical protein